MYCTHRIFTFNPVSAVIVNTRNLILGMLGSSETLVGVVLIILLGCYLQSGPRVGSFLTPAQLNQVSGAHQRLSRAYLIYLFLRHTKNRQNDQNKWAKAGRS